MTSYIERNDPLHLESAADAVLAELAESRNTGRLLAEAVMAVHAIFVDDEKSVLHYRCAFCPGISHELETGDWGIKHEKGCPVLVAKRVSQEITESWALRSACEERDLMAKGLLDCYEYDYDNKFYCGCCGQSFGFGEDLDEHLVHNSECPVLIAKKILNKDNS